MFCRRQLSRKRSRDQKICTVGALPSSGSMPVSCTDLYFRALNRVISKYRPLSGAQRLAAGRRLRNEGNRSDVAQAKVLSAQASREGLPQIRSGTIPHQAINQYEEREHRTHLLTAILAAHIQPCRSRKP